MLCITNMILNGIDTPSGIRHDNTLTKPYRDYGDKDRVPVIATNPPFGGTEEDGIEANFPASLRTRETADLFMALIIKLLKNASIPSCACPTVCLHPIPESKPTYYSSPRVHRPKMFSSMSTPVRRQII